MVLGGQRTDAMRLLGRWMRVDRVIECFELLFGGFQSFSGAWSRAQATSGLLHLAVDAGALVDEP